MQEACFAPQSAVNSINLPPAHRFGQSCLIVCQNKYKACPFGQHSGAFSKKCWQNGKTHSLFPSFHAAFLKCLNPDQTTSWILSELQRFVAIIHQYYCWCCKRDVRLRDKYHRMESCQWAGTPVAIVKPSSCSQYETRARIFFRWRVVQWVGANGMHRSLLIKHQVITIISPSHPVLKRKNMKHTASKKGREFCCRARSNLRAIGSPCKTHGADPGENVKQHYTTWILCFCLRANGSKGHAARDLCIDRGSTDETISHQSDYFFR